MIASLLIGIIFIMSIICASIFVFFKATRIVGKILFTVISFIVLAILTLIGLFLIALSHISVVAFMVSLVLFSLFLYLTIISLIWKALRIKPLLMCGIIGLVLCLIVSGGFFGNYLYHKNIPTVSDNDFSYLDYSPYRENTLVAELNNDSSLKIDSDIPVLDGATALYPIYSSFAKAVYPQDVLIDEYEVISEVNGKNKRYIPIEKDTEFLKCTRTGQAYRNIVTGDADIIFVAGPSKEQEEFARDNGVKLKYIPIGKEAFVFFVNSKNKISNLSQDDIRDIYSGKVTHWKNFGNKRLGKIQAFQRAKNSGSQTMLEKIMGDTPIMDAPSKQVTELMGGIIDKVSDYKNYKNAIGYSFRFYSTEMVKNDDIKLLSVDGVFPSVDNIENGTYPFASDFYAVIRDGETNENVYKMIEWILGDEGQFLIEETGYTPIK